MASRIICKHKLYCKRQYSGHLKSSQRTRAFSKKRKHKCRERTCPYPSVSVITWPSPASLLNYVPYVPTCQIFLRADVLWHVTCQRAYVPNFLGCQRAMTCYVPTCQIFLRANVPWHVTCLRANFSCVPTCHGMLCAKFSCVPTCHGVLRAKVPNFLSFYNFFLVSYGPMCNSM